MKRMMIIFHIKNWKIPEFYCDIELNSIGSLGYVNPYAFFSEVWPLWPRGYPLEQVRVSKNDHRVLKQEIQSSVGVWQGLADNHPDVDAIFRLIYDENIKFNKNKKVYIPENTFCPFNSQNTAWRKEIFIAMYLPAYVNFRFTDILRSYVAQALLWKNDFVLGFHSSTVYQERNIHNLMDDFKDEIPCYLDIEKVRRILFSIKTNQSNEDYMYEIYNSLIEKIRLLVKKNSP